MWGYWPNFGVNIFEYVSLSDIIRVAIIPVGSVFIFVLIGFCLGETTVADILPKSGGNKTIIGRFLNKIKWLLILIYAAVVFILIFYPVPNKWFVLPTLLMLPFYLPLKGAGFLSEIKNDSIRSIIIIATIALPLYSYAIGKINADKILRNTDYQYMELVKEGKKQRLKFLGYANQYVFLLSMNNQDLVISKIDKVSPMYLHYRESGK